MKWFRLLLAMFLLVGMLLGATVAYADDPPDGDSDTTVDIDTTSGLEVDIAVSDASDTVMDIGVSGDFGVDIKASGPAELNVEVEGPSEVHIDAGDEVRLNVQASDESQVFVDDRSLDNPAQRPDGPAGYQESGGVDDSSRFNGYLPVISGAFPAAGLFAFFLIRRRAKRAESQPKGGRNEVV